MHTCMHACIRVQVEPAWLQLPPAEYADETTSARAMRQAIRKAERILQEATAAQPQVAVTP